MNYSTGKLPKGNLLRKNFPKSIILEKRTSKDKFDKFAAYKRQTFGNLEYI